MTKNKSVESYSHKLAKELLYNQIKEKCYFETKNYGDISLGNHGIYMEFPCIDGYYPWECMCKPHKESKESEYCPKLVEKEGYCKCLLCKYLDRNGAIIHDIASIHKGHVVWAIEIINKHEPEWKNKTLLQYSVYIVYTNNVLERIENSPVYVNEAILKNFWT